MSTLAVDKVRAYEFSGEDLYNDLPVIAADIIYEGAAVGDNASGYFRPLVAGDPFGGFASARADNAGGAAGAINVRVRAKGLAQLPVTGVSGVGQVGDAVYASDDDTFTTTSGGNSAIGKVHRFVSSGIAIVYFEAASLRV